MIAPTTNWEEHVLADDGSETVFRDPLRRDPPVNGVAKSVSRLPLFTALPAPGNGTAHHADDAQALAAFCFEPPGSDLGRYVTQVLAALGKRHIPVHLFVREPMATDVADMVVHAVGSSPAGNLLAQVQEFTRRAGNAFLQRFPNGADVTLMGFEWSAVPVLSLLRGIKNAATILSLHSLERQRSDMSSVLSQEIEAIELAGLHEAQALWVHDPATVEVAKFWVPACAERMVPARQPFPCPHFSAPSAAAEVKARYQVGPTDPTILFVGDLHERYGPDLLVKALPPILKNHPQTRLLMVGEGELHWPLRVYCRYLFLEHAVRLVGDLQGQALYDLIRAADIIAVPSREATPWWPILAGWAAGRPVAATHQAAPAFLAHEQDSVLFYPSENSCVWGIERFLYDADLCRRTARQGALKLEERFGWNNVASQVEELMRVRQAR
jgi:glycosyltransferase involved in cell wall biosynthesis